jgi:hypothetical protein
MKYSRQDLFQFREHSLRIDSAVQQRLQSLRLCRRPRGSTAGRRHSSRTAHSTPYKRKQHLPFNFTTVGLGMLFQLLTLFCHLFLTTDYLTLDYLLLVLILAYLRTAC